MSWLIQPLGPALVLGVGALALVLSHALPWRRGASILALLANLGALAVLMALRSPYAAVIAGRPWTSVLFHVDGGLIWQVNTWTWGGGLIVLLLSLVLPLLAWEESTRLASYHRAADLASAAMALLVLFSGNLLTLAHMWVLMESVAMARLALEPIRQPETGRAGLSAASALLVAMACPLSGPALLTSPLSTAMFTPLVQGLLVLAVALRAAVYPLHGWLTHSRLSSPTDRISVYLIPATAGLWLLGTFNSAAEIVWLGGQVWKTLWVVGLLGSALAAWMESDRSRSLDLVCANRAGLIVLAMSMWPGQGMLPLAGWLLAFSLGLGMLFVAHLVYQEWRGRWPAALAIATLLGYPATAGFLGQPWTAQAMPSIGYVILWAAITLADALLLAAVLRGWQPAVGVLPSRLSGRQSRLLATAVLLAVPIMVTGLRPSIVLRLGGIMGSTAGLWPLFASTPPPAWGRLLVVTVLGLWLSRRYRPVLIGWQEIRRGLARVARLDWVYSLIRNAIWALMAIWRMMLRVLEGEGYLGWVLLTLLLIWILVKPWVGT